MGMRARLRQVEDTELERFLKTPNLLYEELLKKGATASAAAPMPALSGTDLAAGLSSAQEALRRALRASPAMQRLQETLAQFRKGEIDLSQLQASALQDQAEIGSQMEAAMEPLLSAYRNNPAAQKLIEAARSGTLKPAFPEDLAEIGLEKSWHCLHYLFTGRAGMDPGSTRDSPVLGGTEIPDVQGVMPYGPVRWFRAAQVPAVHAQLTRFDRGKAIRGYEPDRAEALGVYVAEHEPEELEYYSELLVRFFGDAARNSRGVLSWVE